MDSERFFTEFVTKAFDTMMEANSADIYDHAEYERCSRVLNAAILIFTDGDQHHADAVRECLSDTGNSNPNIVSMDRDEAIVEFGCNDQYEMHAANDRLYVDRGL